MVRWLTVTLTLALAGCVHTFPPQYGLDDLRADSEKWPGEALVHFLSRPEADAAACVRSNFTRADWKLVDPFVASLAGSKVPLATWGACATKLLPTLAPEHREHFLAQLADLTSAFISQPDFKRLSLVHQLLSTRARETSAALRALRPKLRSTKPEARQLDALLAELRLTLELEDGLMNGERLSPQVVLQQQDEGLLRRIEARCPEEEVRTSARRRIVQLHLAQSTVPEVKARAAEVEELVFATGRWAQPVARLAAAAPQPALTLGTGLHASQDIASQLVRLFVAGDEARRAPALDLRPIVRFHVGWSQPLGLCAPPAALDVTPCIAAAEVELGTGFATLDGDGVLHVPQKLAMADAVDLTRAGLGLVVPLRLGGRLAQVLQVPFTVLAPSSFCFEGEPSSPGPAVSAVVVPATQGLLVDAVDEKARRRQFVLPRGASSFEFGSCGGRGRAGAAGSAGLNGSRGSNGSSASCPSMSGGNGGPGGNGSPGGAGGNGTPGGDGGPVKVELLCGRACDDEPFVKAVMRSRGGLGGEGGPGGRGGRGGDGGAGGSGTSCYQNGKSTYASGGSQGSRGSDGSAGAPGQRGAPGHDGAVQVLVR
ncbi:MAG: hypothetical protein Q8L48_31270 [Archangium sp.]|nr:hypothetical protein [Archangium sp.]